MAVITLKSDPAQYSMTARWSVWYDDDGSAGGRAYQTVAGSSQIVSFNLAPLGASPVITDIALAMTSTHSQEDAVSIVLNRIEASGTPLNPNRGLTTAVKKRMIDYLNSATRSGTPISATITFRGTTPPVIQESMQSSTVSVSLILTTQGEVTPADTRSSGTVSETSIAFGESVGLAVTPIDSSCSHTVTYQIGSHNETHTLAAGVTEDSFTLPAAWLDALPRAVSGTMTVTLTTLKDGASVGAHTYTVNVTVPITVVPTAGTLTAEAVNHGALAGDTRFFAGASQALLTLTGAAAGQGSQIASITYSGWGESVVTTALQYTTSALMASGEVALRALVTDLRGRTAETYVSVLVYDYDPPYFTDIVVTRCDTSGVPDDEGTAVLVDTSFGCSTRAIQDNTATATVAFQPRGSTTWSQEFTLNNGEETLITGYPLSATVSYQMRFTVTDRAMSVQVYMSVPSAKYVLHFLNGGSSIGVGQAAEALDTGEVGKLSVNPDWTVKLGTEIYIGNQTLAAYIRSVVSSM